MRSDEDLAQALLAAARRAGAETADALVVSATSNIEHSTTRLDATCFYSKTFPQSV